MVPTNVDIIGCIDLLSFDQWKMPFNRNMCAADFSLCGRTEYKGYGKQLKEICGLLGKIINAISN